LVIRGVRRVKIFVGRFADSILRPLLIAKR
jgi:hypothetical protein